MALGNVLCHHNRHMTGHYEFLHGEDDLPSFEYFRKITLTTSLRKARRGRKPSSLLMRYNIHSFWRTTVTDQANGTTTIFSFGYLSCTWPRSAPFCRQNPSSGCNSGINLVVAFEYTFVQICSNAE